MFNQWIKILESISSLMGISGSKLIDSKIVFNKRYTPVSLGCAGV